MGAITYMPIPTRPLIKREKKDIKLPSVLNQETIVNIPRRINAIPHTSQLIDLGAETGSGFGAFFRFVVVVVFLAAMKITFQHEIITADIISENERQNNRKETYNQAIVGQFLLPAGFEDIPQKLQGKESGNDFNSHSHEIGGNV